MKASWILSAACALLAAPALADHSSGNRSLHLHDDVNRDYYADILFRGGTALAYWTVDFSGAQPVVSSQYAGDAGPGYTVVAVSDFDGDGSADVLWTNGTDLKLWRNDGAGRYHSVPVGSYGGGWEPFAAGDINGDGKSDLFFRGATHLAYWLMDGPSVIRSSYAGDGGAGYRVVAIADFTGRNVDLSRSVDVLWTNGSQLKVWASDAVAGTFHAHALGSYGGGWEPFAAGNLNGDDIADVLFRGGTHAAYWLIGTTAPFSHESRYAGDGGPGFRAIAVSEYYHEELYYGVADVLWTNGSQLKLWRGMCPRWDWDYGCSEVMFTATDIAGYGGGWAPLEMLIPAR